MGLECDDDVFEFQCSVYDLYNRGGVIDQHDEFIRRTIDDLCTDEYVERQFAAIPDDVIVIIHVDFDPADFRTAFFDPLNRFYERNGGADDVSG